VYIDCVSAGNKKDKGNKMKNKKKNGSSAPVCAFCGRSGNGVLFAIFNPRFKPFGSACVDCESRLPADAKLPVVSAPLAALRYHVSGAIARGDAVAIAGVDSVSGNSPGYPGPCPKGMNYSSWLAFNNVD